MPIIVTDANGVKQTILTLDAVVAALAPLATDADVQAGVGKMEAVRALLAAALTVNLPAGASTAALQSTGNSALANILTALSTLATDADLQAVTAKMEAVRALLAAVLNVQGTVTANLGTLNGAALDATVSALGTKLDTLHTDSGTTLHADLGALLTKLGTTLAVSLASVPLATNAATATAQATILAQIQALNAVEAPYQGVISLTAGTPGTAGRALRVVCTTAGNITVTYADASTDTIPVNVGLSYVPGAITTAAIPGSGGAVATFANMK